MTLPKHCDGPCACDDKVKQDGSAEDPSGHQMHCEHYHAFHGLPGWSEPSAFVEIEDLNGFIAAGGVLTPEIWNAMETEAREKAKVAAFALRLRIMGIFIDDLAEKVAEVLGAVAEDAKLDKRAAQLAAEQDPASAAPGGGSTRPGGIPAGWVPGGPRS